MSIALPDLALFRAVMDARGVAAAAQALGSSPPAVSRRLAALEAQLGVRLAERSSRRFRPTPEGELLYERACSILAEVRDAEAEVVSRGSAARGLLRVGAPTEFGRRHLAALVGTFARRHPGLHAHLVLSDAGLEVGEDAFDVVLRMGLPDTETLVALKVATSPVVACASPGYLARHGMPHTPADLAGHDCLVLARRRGRLDEWTFVRDGETYAVRVRGSLSSASGEVVHGWALAGFGISMEAAWDVAEDLASGALVALLPGYHPAAQANLFATFAPGRPVPPRVRLFVDFVSERLAASHPPGWFHTPCGGHPRPGSGGASGPGC